MPGAVPIGEAPRRRRVQIAGVIRRMTVFPMRDGEALEARVADGTGEVVVRFMGRRAIGGLGLGSKIVVEGVIGEQQGDVADDQPAPRVQRLSVCTASRSRPRASRTRQVR